MHNRLDERQLMKEMRIDRAHLKATYVNVYEGVLYSFRMQSIITVPVLIVVKNVNNKDQDMNTVVNTFGLKHFLQPLSRSCGYRMVRHLSSWTV